MRSKHQEKPSASVHKPVASFSGFAVPAVHIGEPQFVGIGGGGVDSRWENPKSPRRLTFKSSALGIQRPGLNQRLQLGLVEAVFAVEQKRRFPRQYRF